MGDSWSEQAIEALERGGNRSSVRRAIVEKLAEQHCAVSAAELADQLGAGGRRVGRATVYRTFEGLRALHMVQRLDLGRDGARYEPARSDEDHHHHFVCTNCGDVVPFSDPALERAIDRLAERAELDVTTHEVVLHGDCHRCN